MHLSELKSLHVSALLEMALSLDIDNAARMRKQELMFAILKKRAKAGEQVYGDGALEILPDGFGFLRSPDASYMASPRWSGRNGCGAIRSPRLPLWRHALR